MLYYAGIPIIAIDRLHPGWPGYGNRYVMALPHIDQAMPAARDAGLFKDTGPPQPSHRVRLLPALAITRRLVFCSRKCALKPAPMKHAQGADPPLHRVLQ